MPTLLTNKTNNDDEYDLNLFQTIIDVLKNKPEATEILDIINGTLDHLDIGALRTKIVSLYNQENQNFPLHWLYQIPNGLWSIFNNIEIHRGNTHDALFSLLLLLTKYAPSNDIEDDNYLCPISYNAIEAENRLLTINGKQFEKESLKTWLNNHNKNPLTQKEFSIREYNYLIHQSKINNENEPEIPFPSESTSQALTLLIISYRCLKILIECVLLAPLLLGVIGAALYLTYHTLAIFWGAPGEILGIMLAGIGLAACAGGALAIGIVLPVVEATFFVLEKMVSSIKNCFFPTHRSDIPHPTIEQPIQNFFSFLKNYKIRAVEENKPDPVENPSPEEKKPTDVKIPAPSPTHSTQQIQQLLIAEPPTPREVIVTKVKEPTPVIAPQRLKNDVFLTRIEHAAKEEYVTKLKVG